MMILYSKIIGTPIFAVKSQALIGHVCDVVIKKSEFTTHGFVIKTSFLPIVKHKVVAINDVIELSNDGLVVENENLVSDLKDAVRLSQAIEDGFVGVGQRVVTESGKRIGKVYDYLISVPDLTISRIYIKNLFSERILPVAAIKSFKKGMIVVRDDYDLAPVDRSVFAAAEA